MLLRDYIQSDKRGKEANRLEREAMNDPFLQEALEGLENVAGDHATIIDRLEKRITNSPTDSQKKRKGLFYLSIAAYILLLIGFGIYFLVDKTEQSSEVLAEAQSIHLPESTIPEESKAIKEFQRERKPESEASKKIAPASPKTSETLNIREKSSSADTGAYSLSEFSETYATVQDVSENKITVRERQPEQSNQKPAVNKTEEFPDEPAALRIDEQKDKNVKNTVSRSYEKSAFGEKEFQTWCQQKADKNICDGKGATVEVSFFIDETGKPAIIGFKNYSCKEAKKEAEKLLASSPDWTERNRKVTMTIKW